MNKKYRLTKSYDIDKLVKMKKSVGNKMYAIYFCYYEGDACVAISVSKKFGSAVERNYEKRVTREIVRKIIDNLKGLKLLIVVKSNVKELEYCEKERNISYLIKKIKGEKNE